MARRLRRCAAGAVLLAILASVPAVAGAAPVTVDLRVEGPSATLFEAPVTTDVRTFDFTGEAKQRLCDGTAAAGGSSASPVPTRGAAIAAAIAGGLNAAGSWFPGLGASFDTIAGSSVAYDAGTNAYLVEYLNGVSSMTGACGDPVKNGDEVLFAYGTGSEPLLKLTLPVTAAPGAPLAGKVTEIAGGAPVAGATVAGAQSGADGGVVLPGFAERGQHALKASKAGTIRSARAVVCVTDGTDGFCGSSKPSATPVVAAAPDTTPALPLVGAIREGARFTRATAPRTLSGTVATDASGLRDVLLRLTRRAGGRCEAYDAARERWTRAPRCGTEGGRWFSVGSRAAWSYLLPGALTAGRYVLDVRTIDGAGNITRGAERSADPARPRTRVVFTVR